MTGNRKIPPASGRADRLMALEMSARLAVLGEDPMITITRADLIHDFLTSSTQRPLQACLLVLIDEALDFDVPDAAWNTRNSVSVGYELFNDGRHERRSRCSFPTQRSFLPDRLEAQNLPGIHMSPEQSCPRMGLIICM
jgi:hypothetical protein